MNKILQLIFIILITIYLFYGIDFSNFNLSIFSIYGLILTAISIFLSQIILSVRWMVMSKLSFKVSLETIVVSSALNILLPARLGEFSKAIYLKKFYNYSYNRTISVIFIERFFDIVMLFLLMCASAYLYVSSDILKNFIIMLTIGIIAIIVLFNSKTTLIFLKKIPFQYARIYTQKIYKNINKLLKNPYPTLFYTAVLWFFYLLSNTLFFMYSVNFHLTFQESLELFIFFTIALSIPITPAGIGTFEGAIVLFLTHHGVDKADALVSATIYHIMIFAIDFIMLYAFLIIKDIKFKDLLKK